MFKHSLLNGLLGERARLSSSLRRTLVAALMLVVVGAVVSSKANAAAPDPTGTVYVSDCEANAIDVFAPGATGNIAPERSMTRSRYRPFQSLRCQSRFGWPRLCRKPRRRQHHRVRGGGIGRRDAGLHHQRVEYRAHKQWN